ncbi:MAG TPA: HEAT repeat domain-containing protein [Candidatus Elarobacter sp.]|nr:HEAT repeat domain-containing protein [Candidatus Elarobacter sp.]
MGTFAAIVLALGVVNSILLIVLAARRYWLANDSRRHDEVASRLRPNVLAFLDGDEELPDDLPRRERTIVAGILSGYGRLVRGPGRERIAAYFEQHGDIERELDTMRNDRAHWRRAGAAFRLGDIGSPLAEQALIDALGDEDRDVRSAATRSLGCLRSIDGIGPLIAAVADDRVPTALARWAVLQVGAPALPELRNLLQSDSADRRAGAVMLIGHLGDAADAELIEERLHDASAAVREEAARALGRIGGSRSVPWLVAALSDRVPGVRASAASALGRLRADAVPPLLLLADHDQFDVARAAAQAAAHIDLEATAFAAGMKGASPHLLEAVDKARLA